MYTTTRLLGLYILDSTLTGLVYTGELGIDDLTNKDVEGETEILKFPLTTPIAYSIIQLGNKHLTNKDAESETKLLELLLTTPAIGLAESIGLNNNLIV